jgi:hypothetical protein
MTLILATVLLESHGQQNRENVRRERYFAEAGMEMASPVIDNSCF